MKIDVNCLDVKRKRKCRNAYKTKIINTSMQQQRKIML